MLEEKLKFFWNAMKRISKRFLKLNMKPRQICQRLMKIHRISPYIHLKPYEAIFIQKRKGATNKNIISNLTTNIYIL